MPVVASWGYTKPGSHPAQRPTPGGGHPATTALFDTTGHHLRRTPGTISGPCNRPDLGHRGLHLQAAPPAVERPYKATWRSHLSPICSSTSSTASDPTGGAGGGGGTGWSRAGGGGEPRAWRCSNPSAIAGGGQSAQEDWLSILRQDGAGPDDLRKGDSVSGGRRGPAGGALRLPTTREGCLDSSTGRPRWREGGVTARRSRSPACRADQALGRLGSMWVSRRDDRHEKAGTSAIGAGLLAVGSVNRFQSLFNYLEECQFGQGIFPPGEAGISAQGYCCLFQKSQRSMAEKDPTKWRFWKADH